MRNISVYRSFNCQNPSGITPNIGWYALCECVLTDHTPCDVLYRWCGLEKKSKPSGRASVTRRYVHVDVVKLRRLKEEQKISFSAMAKMAGTSLYPFWKLFRNNEGRILEGSLRMLEEKMHLKRGELELIA